MLKKLFALTLALFSPLVFAATVNIYTVVSAGTATALGLPHATIAAVRILALNVKLANSGVTGLAVANVGSEVSVLLSYDSKTVGEVLSTLNYSALIGRDATSADVTAYIINPGFGDRGQAGDGTGSASNFLPSEAHRAKFAIRLDGIYYPYNTFEHEFGHVMGLRHPHPYGSYSNDGTTTPYSYGHGWQAKANESGLGLAYCRAYCFHTIMSSGNAGGCPTGLTDVPLDIYSNPSIVGNHSSVSQFSSLCMIPYGHSTLGNEALALSNTAGQTLASSWRYTKLAPKAIGVLMTIVGMFD
jgi:hypothetical protein